MSVVRPAVVVAVVALVSAVAAVVARQLGPPGERRGSQRHLRIGLTKKRRSADHCLMGGVETWDLRCL